MEITQIKQGLKSISKYLLVTFVALVGIWFMVKIGPQFQHNYALKVHQSMIELEYYGAKDKLVESINNYIDSIAPNSALNGLAIVDACDEYGVDLIFVLAQGQIESAFGTKGIARKTNSVWNVKAYDGRSAEHMIRKGDSYDHPDKSIRPYLQLLTDNYFSDKVTEYGLMIKYINKKGKRYASDPNYEHKLAATYIAIKQNTAIYNNLQKYNKFKVILEAR